MRKYTKPFNLTRHRIIEFIRENPGAYPSAIARELDLWIRGVAYHLESLLAEKIVIARPVGKYKYYYPYGYCGAVKSLTPREQEVFDVLKDGSRTKREIADTLDKTPMAVKRHLQTLSRKGLIKAECIAQNIPRRYVIVE